MRKFATLIVALLSSLAPAARAADRSAAPPNVVFLISDDHHWADYAFMGHAQIKTPHLDKFASQSALFTRGYVPNSLCRPSLATMITGLYTHTHGVLGNDPAPPAGAGKNMRNEKYAALREGIIKQFEKNTSLAKTLADKGYLSLQTGKWWEGDPKRHGFTDAMTHGDITRGGRHGDVGLTVGRQTMQPIYDFLDKSAKEKKPFFLWYAPFLPHDPHNPPQRLLAEYKDKTDSIHVARYWAMVEWFDETCGDLLSQLDKRGLSENTIVIYVSDNGWIQNTDKPSFAPRSKRSHYDGGLRTPIMVRWPGKVTPGRDEKTLVSSIDIVPTVLAACGLAPDDTLPGVNLLELVAPDYKKPDGRAAKRTAIYGDVYEHDIPDITDVSKGLTHRWIIEGHYKLIVPHGEGEIELYDVIADPHEKNNLAAAKADVVSDLRIKLNAWWKPEKR
ncbi:MAG: sulfatase [Phycisphaeraceae bacterium]